MYEMIEMLAKAFLIGPDGCARTWSDALLPPSFFPQVWLDGRTQDRSGPCSVES